MPTPHSLMKRGGLKYELEELLGIRVDVIYSSNPALDNSALKDAVSI